MIDVIRLQNFKCYKEQDFNLSHLTVFCGSNSSGKSTAIQSILLYFQNHINGNIQNGKLALMGEYYSFGTLADIQCHSPTSKYIELQLNNSLVKISEDSNILDTYIATLDEKVKVPSDLFNHNFIYLSADRYGPKNSSNIKFENKDFDVGIYGEYAFSEYDRLRAKMIPNKELARALNSGGSGDISVKVAIENAMADICPGFTIETQSIKNMDKVITNFSTVNDKPIRPTNVGFGYSCIFPIVLAAICIESGGTLIIENPEIHLHPAAQSQLARFLALVSRHNIQVIIETHSDHIVNGIRVFAKENSIEDKSIIVNSISTKEGERYVKEIIVDDDGNFTDVDDGFFDQIENDLIKLF